MLEIFFEVIKEDISQPGPEDQTEDQVEIKIQELLSGKEGRFLPGQLEFDQEIRKEKSEKVHQSVPADLQRAERNQNRINIGKREHRMISLIYFSLEGEVGA
jgi:hypothetical protein